MLRRTHLFTLAVVFMLCRTGYSELVAYWDLEEGSGTTTTAAVGSPAADGTFIGATWITTDLSPAEGTTAAAFFNSNNSDRIETNLTGITGQAARSVAAWVKAEPTQNNNGVIVGWGPNNTTERYAFRLNGNAANGSLRALRLEISGSYAIAQTPLNDGQWHHVVLTHEDGATVDQANFYVDGRSDGDLSGTSGGGTINTGATTVVIGNSGHSVGNYGFDGAIDDVRIYSKALSPKQVLDLFNGISPSWLKAQNPAPADGDLLEATWMNLGWLAGDLAVSHDLYFGTSFVDVNDGTEGTFVGNLATTSQVVGFPSFPASDGLQPGTTYYWRIDEVNDANPNSPWKGDVWSFTVPPRTAYNNSPADGATNVLQNVTLNWTPGLDAMLHNVYFGDNFDDVNNAEGALPVTDTTYTPGTLEMNKTYYWRVDEFTGGVTHRGDVWSFTTVPDIAITNPSLMLWWTLDEAEGKTAVDWSGHGNHGAIMGGAQWADGYQRTALGFDGSERYVLIPHSDSLKLINQGDFAIAMWFKQDAITVANLLQQTDRNGIGRTLLIADSTGIRSFLGGINTLSGVVHTAGMWCHVAVVVTEGEANDTISFFVNGEPSGAPAQVVLEDCEGDYLVGTDKGLAGRWLTGLVDDVRFYNRNLTATEIQQLMLGDTKLAANPEPQRHAIVDIRKTTSLSWSAGDAAASHDVYFGTDRDAVAGADNNTPEFQGNQAGTSLSVAGMIEFGGGDYYWRVDEVEADGTAPAGTIWKFTVPDYLIVDDFEIYDVNNNEIWWSWKDGLGYPARDGIPAYPGNGTGSAVGDETSPTYMEMSIVHGGAKSMPMWYTNNNPIGAKYSEVELTLPVGERDWTINGIGELSLWFRGDALNAPEPLYVALAGTAVVYNDDPNATQAGSWTNWVIPLQDFAALGANLANVDRIAIGVGTRGNTATAGTMGKMYFDDILLSRPPEETTPQP